MKQPSLHKLLSVLAVSLLFVPGTHSFADTKGKLTGRIVDDNNQGVVGANVLIVGTTIGAAADEEGRYVIINVPAGVYDVRYSAVGYQTKLVKEVHVNAGQSTTMNVTISEELINAGEVTTVAERPLVDTRQTSAVAILSKEDIGMLPVQSLSDVVNLQAGVVDGHFAGGRSDEVQYQVDGVSVNNPYDNTSVVQLDKSVLQEVQVISGTFDAEYGQAMSGVVNAVLRSGSEERFEANLEVYGGTYAPNNTGDFPHAKVSLPPAAQSFTASLSGPAGIPNTSFLINARRFIDDGYLYGERRFVPTDVSNFATKEYSPTGDGEVAPMMTQREWSGQFKISNRSLRDIQLSYQAIGAIIEGRQFAFGYRFNPDGTTRQERTSLVHGPEITHTLSPTTFYTLSIRQNYFRYLDYAFASIMDSQSGAFRKCMPLLIDLSSRSSGADGWTKVTGAACCSSFRASLPLHACIVCHGSPA